MQAQVVAARPAFDRRDAALAFSTIDEYEASLRGQVAAFLASVDQYIGRTVDEAREMARADADDLCVHPSAHRSHLSPRRIHIKVEAGTIVDAYRDRPVWLIRVWPLPSW